MKDDDFPTAKQIIASAIFIWTTLFIVIAFFSGGFGLIYKLASLF